MNPLNLQRVPADAIIAEIEKQLGSYDRTPFHNQLARAIACGPSRTAWQRLAKQNPEKWARALTDLSRVSGFADRKEQIVIKPEPEQVAKELVARFGRAKACTMLESAGLPTSLIGDTVDGEITLANVISTPAPEPA